MKGCCCYHHSVPPSLCMHVVLAKQTMLFCNTKVLLFSSWHTFPNTSERQNFTSGNLTHFLTRVLLRHTHKFSYGNAWLMITTSLCKYVKLQKFLSESLLMGCQKSSRKVGQQLRDLLERFSK